MSPLVSHIYELGLVEADRHPADRVLRRRDLTFARTEGIVPAPGADPRDRRVRSARPWRCKETGEEKVILTALCGHGHLDLAAYETYLAGKMVDDDLTDKELADPLTRLPQIDL